MKMFRILSTILIFAVLLSTVNLAPLSVSAQTPAPAKSDIPNLAPAWVSDSGQLLSNGPEVKVERTGQEPPPTTKKTPIKIGFTPSAMNTHYDIVIAGAKQAIQDLGGPSVIDMVIQAPSSQEGTSEQVNIVEGWIQQGYDAIAICAISDQALTPVYKAAAAKGIPVFIFNTPVPMSVNPYYVSNIGYDQHEAGRLIGLWLGQHFGDKPTNVAVIEGLPGVHNDQRLGGFKDAIQGNPNLKIVASQPADWVRDKAQTVMENMLTANPDINVVWGMYDEMALGGLAAIKSRNLGGKIAIMGYDNTPDANQAIKRGEMNVTVDTAPKEMGYDLIQTIKKYVIDGQMVPKVVNCQISVWDQSNIDKFDTTEYTIGPMPKKTGAAPAAGAPISDTTQSGTK